MTTASYRLRWKGREFGPFDQHGLILALRARTISLAHEIHRGSGWIPLRQFLAEAEESDALESGQLRAVLEQSESEKTVVKAQLAALERQVDHLKVQRLLGQLPEPPARWASVSRVPVAIRYAGFWRRGLARVIDLVVVGAALAIVGFFATLMTFILPTMFGVLCTPDSASRATAEFFLICSLIVLPLGYWLYCAKLESSPRQATIGKAALGLKVTLEDGGQLTFWRSTLRHFAWHLSVLPLGGGLFAAIFSPKHQALHDVLAGTIVTIGGYSAGKGSARSGG